MVPIMTFMLVFIICFLASTIGANSRIQSNTGIPLAFGAAMGGKNRIKNIFKNIFNFYDYTSKGVVYEVFLPDRSPYATN